MLAAVCTLALPAMVSAGPHTVAKNQACPDSWALTNATIDPAHPTNVWGVASGSVDDKAVAEAHLAGQSLIETVEQSPVTSDDLVNDLLTVASECLVYRNFEIDTLNYVAPAPVTPAPVTPNVAMGWLPAILY